MKLLPLITLLLFPLPALAEQLPPPAPSTTVLLPRALVDALRSWFARPDAATAVPLFLTLDACEAANAPTPPSPDQCPAITSALRAQREAARAPATVPAAPAAPAPAPAAEADPSRSR